MTPLSQLQFRVRELPQSRELSLTAEFLRDALAAVAGQDAIEDDALGQVDVRVEVTEQQGAVIAQGRLRGVAKVACSRCLGPVTLDVDEAFTLTFLAPEAGEGHEEDVELDDDDIDVAAYDGVTVDLTAVLRDHIVLSVPYAPLCADSCKGLCAQCGADLNEGPCSCTHDEAGSAFTALAGLVAGPSNNDRS